jgi:uncharacterized membrane protein YuzA (DUF378 family)
MEEARSLIIFLIINLSAFLCYLLGKADTEKRKHHGKKKNKQKKTLI